MRGAQGGRGVGLLGEEGARVEVGGADGGGVGELACDVWRRVGGEVALGIRQGWRELRNRLGVLNATRPVPARDRVEQLLATEVGVALVVVGVA